MNNQLTMVGLAAAALVEQVRWKYPANMCDEAIFIKELDSVARENSVNAFLSAQQTSFQKKKA